MSVDCHWSHWSYLQCYCQCRPTLFFLIDQEFYTVHCLQWWFHLRKYSMQPSGTRLLEKRKSTRELEILLCADQGHNINLCEHLEGCQTTALLLTSAGAPSLFKREKPRKHWILFLGFSRKPRNQGGVKIARSESEGQGFFALKAKPGKCGKLSPGFPGFSRNSWKARGAWTLLDFPTFFLAFPHLQKILQSQEFSAKIDPGEFRTPFSRVNPNKKPKCHNSRNFDG